MQSESTRNTEYSNTTLWLSALQVEVAPILALLEGVISERIAGQECWRGYLRGHRLYVAVSGAGGQACERMLATLLDNLPDARVLLAGIAGAINPALNIGDVVVASRAISWPRQDPQTLDSAPILGATGRIPGLEEEPERESTRAFRIVSGCILSWDEPVLDKSLRSRLYEDYGSDCVDMETGYAARVCTDRGLPFLAIRGISDQANTNIRELKSTDIALAAWHAAIVAVEALTWSDDRTAT